MAETYKTARVLFAPVIILRPIMMILIVVLSVLIVQVWSRDIVVNTTSGRLLGTQADGGMHFLWLLLSYLITSNALD